MRYFKFTYFHTKNGVNTFGFKTATLEAKQFPGQLEVIEVAFPDYKDYSSIVLIDIFEFGNEDDFRRHCNN